MRAALQARPDWGKVGLSIHSSELRGLEMMKTGAATAMAVIAWVALTIAPFGAAHAAGMYVRDWITITVRAEPDDNAKIIDVAKSNDYLEVLSERGDWTRVRSGKGKDGWVVSRYL